MARASSTDMHRSDGASAYRRASGLASMRNPSLSNIRIEARFSGSTDNPAEKFFHFHGFALAHPHCH